MLACARIGAIHSIVFGGFSAEALADRIADSSCSILITCNGTYRGDKAIEMKPVADEAIDLAEKLMDSKVNTCIVVERVKNKEIESSMNLDRDFWWHNLMNSSNEICDAQPMDSEDPLFILYTSGSTGKPK